MTFCQWDAGTKCPRRTLGSLLPSLAMRSKPRMFTRTCFMLLGFDEEVGRMASPFSLCGYYLCCNLQNLKKDIAPAIFSHHSGTTIYDKHHTHTARTHVQIKFINSYLPVKKIMFTFSILKTHPNITYPQRNVHLNHAAGIRVKAERSEVWYMSN